MRLYTPNVTKRVTDGFPLGDTKARYFVLFSTKNNFALISPDGGVRPCTRARYTFCTRCSANSCVNASALRALHGTTRQPEVFLSNLDTDIICLPAPSLSASACNKSNIVSD